MSATKDLPPVLTEMAETMAAPDPQGEVIPVHSHIGLEHCAAIQRVCRVRQPQVCIESGLAFGFSTLAMLSGTSGQVISIDPFQLPGYAEEGYNSLGLHAIERAGYSDRHRLLNEPSETAMPRLLQEGVRCQFAYIDGMHKFEYVLLDFFYIDRMLDVGGVVAFNDGWMDSIHRVTRFVTRHRDYREIDVGLEKTYSRMRNPLKALKLRLDDHQAQDRYFEKITDTEPPWHFWADF